ncbi:MAG: glutamate synthase large subunit [Candidatus Omnitrophica bacterium CG11_big_fil_rev_8_21_14_0_20_63_9]|nr:MAG: glutamate synthase large subunit [Candidatus Omnitrophica bacterium CG11_big_fil_rev_8_21_14_0_20_63_9]
MPNHRTHGHIGLYRAAYEHDACGVGFVASIEGQATHAIVQSAVQCVCNVTHRGALSADAKTGDGAGILTQIPHQLFAKVLRQLKAPGVDPGDLGVGVIFFPRDAKARASAKKIVEAEVAARKVQLLGWRDVPVNPGVLGEQAQATLPVIQHLLLERPHTIDPEHFERTLFLIRRRIELAWERAGIADAYIPSFSCRTIAYKGLLVAPQLPLFYRDLSDLDYTSAIAVFHQRYSTNTFPNWFLAQPFRFLGHNGEINTLQGNRNWMAAREPELASKLWGKELAELLPIVQPGGSDSMSLDNVLELLVMSGRDLLHAMMMLVPDAWQGMRDIDIEPAVKAFYQYHAMLMEPWDGPAALAFTDGTVVGATLDRNGLRPARYWVTKDRLVIMASEVGVVEVDPSNIVEKGRLGPGHVFAVDTKRKRLLRNDELKREYASVKPYAEWVKQSVVPVQEILNGNIADEVIVEPESLTRHQIAFGYTNEELQMVIEPMVKSGKEAIWSMGDDAPLSALSGKPKPLFTYFKQLFAQVTNPPIDPIREELVMSLNTILGARANLLQDGPASKRVVRVTSPVLSPQEFSAIRSLRKPDLKSAVVSLLFETATGAAGLRAALARVREDAVKAVDGGATILILSDRGIDAQHAAIPTLLATSAVHHHLIRTGRRMKATIVIESGDVHEVHQVACLIGYGASAVYPYLLYQTIKAMEQAQRLGAETFDQAFAHYRKAVEQGVLKIMSKMGISTIGSYRGAQIFEALGIGKDVIDECFPGTPSRIGGVGYEQLAEEVLAWHREAYQAEGTLHLDDGGFYKYRRDGEYHAFNPEMVRFLQQSIKANDYAIYKKFAESVNTRPPTALRDLLDVKPLGKPVPIDEVEPVEAITKRFATASISYGALSLEAHQTLTIAMNRIGGKSGSGEGGEDPARYHPTDPNMDRNSRIKQVASGRFGVTPEYLMSASELEIKMAQGSKPGEGGQLPGHKVSEDIARVRHTIPGISLISPPPHHDIYSIEDLAQLIYDLKMINPTARVNVKLVSEAGVGTIAAGVAKGHADTILISGHDGGTGASPLSSIKNAGLPWELGLAETQQTLRLNGLRERVVLRADGGMKTGRDLLLAAVFGAEEFGFGTAAVVATGCVMTRQCHLNTCPVGVATQDAKLRARYTGTPEMVANYMRFVAQELREYMAALGARTLDELIGRTELLTRRQRTDLPPKAKTVNLESLMATVDAGPRMHTVARNDRAHDEPLDDQLLIDAKPALDSKTKVKLSYPIRNIHRTVGARLSGAIAKRYGDQGLPTATVDVTLRGVAGQSFGAFCINGLRLALIGEANDYVGKGMAGGELIIRPPDESGYAWHQNVIIGNTCLYGATGGVLYAAGRGGERFAVRNSGAIAVVEGLGDHGCEYMTGGIVLVLGQTGRNFGAGMTGGRAYVLDRERVFEKRVNLELVELDRLEHTEDINNIRTLLERHFIATQSSHALNILTDWDDFQELFWIVIPRGSGARLDQVVSAKEG